MIRTVKALGFSKARSQAQPSGFGPLRLLDILLMDKILHDPKDP